MTEGDRLPAAERPSWRSEWRSLAGLLVFFVVAAIAIEAWHDVPVIDDWTYAWSVEQLLRHGRLAVLDWSAVFPIGPALWGTAWSLVFGFSFVTLRLSTLCLGLVACGALYFILRELEASPRVALLGAASVAVNPVFLLLSSSFMTDVPFVAFTLLALLCYVRALRRGEPGLVWWGGVWACVSCLDRQVGVLTPIAALPLLVTPSGTLTRRRVVAALAATWTAMLVGSLVLTALVPPTGEMDKLADRLSWLTLVPLGTYARYNLYVLSTIAFYALPALLAMAATRGVWRSRTLLVVAAATAVLVFAVAGEIPVPLRPGNTWTQRELGGARQLVSGPWPLFERSWVELVLRGAGLVAMALAVVAGLRRGMLVLDRRVTACAPLAAYFLGYVGLVNVLWFYNDRYALVLLPVVVALALGHRAARVVTSRLAWVVAASFALVAVTGTRDTLRFNQEVRESWQDLVAGGVPPSDIDAGYAWGDWVLYAHPENLGRGLTIRDVPWITSRRRLPYLIAKGPLEGYDVAREIVWDDDGWPGPDRLFVLKRRSAPSAAATPPPPRKPSA